MIFFTCDTDGGVRTPVDGMASQKYNHSDRSAVWCSDEVDIRVSNLVPQLYAALYVQ